MSLADGGVGNGCAAHTNQARRRGGDVRAGGCGRRPRERATYALAGGATNVGEAILVGKCNYQETIDRLRAFRDQRETKGQSLCLIGGCGCYLSQPSSQLSRGESSQFSLLA